MTTEPTLFQSEKKPAAKPKRQKPVTRPVRAIAPKAAPPATPPAAVEPAGLPAEPLQMMGLIGQLAANKDVDADKLDRLLAMQERLMERQAKMAFDAAFVALQVDLPEITKDGRIIVKEKDASGRRTGPESQNTPYAKWETIMPLLKPILHKHGFGISHESSTAPDGRMRITAVLRGHGYIDRSCYIDLQADATGSKNNAQAWGSALSYGKRHTACAVLNIVTKGEDDDARSTGSPLVNGTPMSDDEYARLDAALQATNTDEEKFLAYLNSRKPRGNVAITSLRFLPRERLEEAITALSQKEATLRNKENSHAGKGA